MAITDYKITPGDVDDYKVESAPDTLTGTATENKQVFDQLVKFLIGKYNNLIDFINSTFVTSSKVGTGLVYDDGEIQWRYGLFKGTSIGINFSGNIVQVTTGYQTTIGNVVGLTADDLMNCILSINGTEYECGESWEAGDSAFANTTINGVNVEIEYDGNGNVIISSTSNPLSTAYWNVVIYRTTAEVIPGKALPSSTLGGDMLKSEYDTNRDGIVDNAAHATNADYATTANSASSAAFASTANSATTATTATTATNATNATTATNATKLGNVAASNFLQKTGVKSMVVYTSVSKATGNVSTGTSKSVEWSVSKSGYYPLGIVGWNVGGTNRMHQHVCKVMLTARDSGSATIEVFFYNGSSATFNGDIYVDLLWVKES